MTTYLIEVTKFKTGKASTWRVECHSHSPEEAEDRIVRAVSAGYLNRPYTFCAKCVGEVEGMLPKLDGNSWRYENKIKKSLPAGA